MKLLVTGAAGFIGANFVHYWVKKHPKDKITVVDALTYAGNIKNLDPVKKAVKFVEADINDRKKIHDALKGVDVVVNFAAESHVDRSVYDPKKYWYTNVHGALALLEEARKSGVMRFHQISTDEVYGELALDSDKKFSENSLYSPSSDNIYAQSKAEADFVIRDFGEKNKEMFITISNCSNNFGPFQFPEKFIPIIVTNLIDGIKVPVHGDGRNVRDWIHTRDHSSAIDLILHKGKSGEMYLIGSNNDRSNAYIAERMVKLAGFDQSVINYVPDRHSNDRRYAIDATKIISELGWTPEINRDNFDDGLKETIDWYKNNEGWWRPLLQKKDRVSDSSGKLTAFITLDRVSGKTKFEFNKLEEKTKASAQKIISNNDFLNEHKIRYQNILKNLNQKKWYKNSSQDIKDQVELLGKNPDTFGFVEDLAYREDQINDNNILSLIKIEHADSRYGSIYGIASWFEVETFAKKLIWGYYSWGRGQKSGSKIILLIKNNNKITHVAFQRENEFTTGAMEYSLAGGFSEINEGLLDLVIRHIKKDLNIDLLQTGTLVEEIKSLGKVTPDTGMTDNKPNLYALTVKLPQFAYLKEEEVFENEEGLVVWPVSKLDDLVNKCDDAYFLAAVARLKLKEVGRP